MQEQSNQPLIGRREEQQILTRIFNSTSAEFIAVYGRRRVGKTYLIKTFFKQQDCIFFHITGTREAPMGEQIHDFTREIEAVFFNNEFEMKSPSNWKSTFDLLTKTILKQNNKRKIVLFFDELPWLASKRSRFIQALDYYWNRYWCDMPKLKLIVCGSAASWMLDHVISHKGGLHNRITGQIQLRPFDLQETKQYLFYKGVRYNDNQVLDIFMIIGGIPYYLNFLKKNLSVAQNVDQMCFQQQGPLVDEFTRLYASLFDSPEAYEELVRSIAAKRRGIKRTELLKNAKFSTEGGRANKRLSALEKSGFIVKFKPYGQVKRGTFYQLIDEYSLFYIHWIEPALSSIRQLDKTKGYWLEKSQSPSWRSWAGYAFESVCYKHLAQIRQALNISATADIGSWQYIPIKKSGEEGAQIDLLFDRNDSVVTVCEMKYTIKPYQFTKEEAHSLNKKTEIFKKRTGITKQIHLVLVTNIPIQPTLYSEEIIAHNVTLHDLMG